MSVVQNEQVKLSATFLNGIGIATFAVGGLAPILSAFYGGAGPTGVHIIIGAVCFVASAVLHLAARHLLRRLVP